MTSQRHPPAEGPALEAVHRYFKGINAQDPAVYEDSLHYPHTRHAGGGIRHWEKPPPRGQDFLATLRQATPAWHRSTLEEATVVQSSPDKVHFVVRFTRYDKAGKALETHHSLYVVTRRDGHWGIQIRSSFVPTRQR